MAAGMSAAAAAAELQHEDAGGVRGQPKGLWGWPGIPRHLYDQHLTAYSFICLFIDSARGPLSWLLMQQQANLAQALHWVVTAVPASSSCRRHESLRQHAV